MSRWKSHEEGKALPYFTEHDIKPGLTPLQEYDKPELGTFSTRNPKEEKELDGARIRSVPVGNPTGK